MTSPVFAMQRGPRGFSPVIYPDGFHPSAYDTSITEYATEIPAEHRSKSLAELERMFWRLKERGQLPQNVVRK